ncbi:MAG: hypothetical protein ABT13_01630, partial [Pelagibacterium sp. SCN 68-10]
FVVLMLALTVLFVGLGVWQVQRLAWKEGLIADVEARYTAAPSVLPPPDRWDLVDLDGLNYHPVTVTGTYEPDKTVLVFTSLSEPRGKFGGPGYWVMVPLDAGGGTVFVNRGFVPQANAPAFAQGGTVPAGPQTITGIGVAPEPAGAFTPGPDTAHRIEWVRDPARLAAIAGVSGPVLALTIDAPRGGGAAAGRRNHHRLPQQSFRLCADLVRLRAAYPVPARRLGLAPVPAGAGGRQIRVICRAGPVFLAPPPRFL